MLVIFFLDFLECLRFIGLNFRWYNVKIKISLDCVVIWIKLLICSWGFILKNFG